MDKVDHLRLKQFLRLSICEGIMDKVDHLRGKQF